MRLQRVDAHDVLQGRALLADCQLAVAVRTLEIDVQIGDVWRGLKLLGEQQDPGVVQAIANRAQQRQAVLGRQELQRVVEDHHVRALDGRVAHIRLYPAHTAAIAGQLLRSGQHGRGVVDGHDLARPITHCAQHGVRGGTQRAAEVVAATVLGEMPRRDQAGQRRDRLVTRHGSANHVREDARDGFVENEIDEVTRTVEQPIRSGVPGGTLFGRAHGRDFRVTSVNAANLASPDLFINRELSLLEFNRHVLEQAKSTDVPLLERLRFLCISGSNLDEFFEIRVSGLKQQEALGATQRGPDNLSPTEQLQRIATLAHELVDEQYRVLNDVLFPLLDAEGIRFLRRSQWNAAQEQWLADFFHRELAPILTPIGLDPAHPFPRIINKNLTFIVTLEGKDAFGRNSGMAVVQAPRALPRVVRLAQDLAEHPYDFVFLSSIIHAHVDELFPGMRAVGCYQFRATRNSDLFVDEEAVEDLKIALEGELPARRFGDAVRLELADDCPREVGQFLADEFELLPEDVYYCNGPVNLMRLNAIPDLVDRPDLKYPGFTPGVPRHIQTAPDIFSAIRARDVLLHHPFHSFAPVLDFLRSAARDPDVLSIRQTLYRTGADSSVVDALIEAAANGKEVLVVIELRARFDEAANIELANDLQEAGAQVVYGIVGYKTHAKMLMVIRRENGELRRYVHLSTGNYHASTARLYTDYGLLTCDPELTEDVASMFQQLTAMGRAGQLNKMLQSPFTLHETMLAHIEAEIAHAEAGRPSGVVAKMNQLIEKDVIQALYRASQAGVRVRLVVRGICSLRPGIKGVSENIDVRSIVGRFLEHARIFVFENGGQPTVYLSSADWMGRNFFSRVEACFPIEDKRIKKAVLQEGIDPYLDDNTQAWVLKSDGSYERAEQGTDDRRCAQEELLVKLTR